MDERIYRRSGVSQRLIDLAQGLMQDLNPAFEAMDTIREANQIRGIEALEHVGMQAEDFGGSTGYGYDDRGRTRLEEAWALVFGAERALVRHQFSSGTQVLVTALRGLLRPGMRLVIGTGMPYDSIRPSLGLDPSYHGKGLGSLDEFGIKVCVVPLLEDGAMDTKRILEALEGADAVLYLQRSRGYDRRSSFSVSKLGDVISQVKAVYPRLPCMVDNCYGEFVERIEPTAVGADLVAGSLIKNPGAGIALTGGYVAGKAWAVEQVAHMATATGLGDHVGPSLGFTRDLARGFYLAPMITAEALKGAIFASAMAEALGYETSPKTLDLRTDLVQCISLGSQEALIAFCQAIQASSAVDALYAPEPAPMPGYDCAIIMASGSFVQGSSIELSCDGPLRPPYDAFFQGGMSFDHARWALLRAFDAVERLREEA